ncbi:hypothetical protein TD95_000695 [Thielaviopsis punctulata]|uniref:Glycoside hydrolase 131 catalytic N-terminal domain-containing protein n=1 Tax=Thielaviopsis punctulata TaxID=72032 RepID=A0A0F4ZHR3_9PEZI|nr:hypothetical protein TD95_000695 [Thielaviopsis punctulata]
MKSFASLLFLSAPALASILWDGRFNSSTAAELSQWSWSNQVGPYQYYIHGSGDLSDYVDISTDFKNPGDSNSEYGAKISLTSTSYWEGQNMRRTELIPSTKAAINKGKTVYHFSIMRKDTNAPSVNREHQIAFFESHFCEMKYGWVSGESGTSDTNLQFFANSKSQWKATWEPNVWHNVAYEIDFSGGTVAFWHSTGSDALTKVVDAVGVSAQSNGADWHVGVLELPRSGYTDSNEDFYFAGVYIEDGDVTTTMGGSSSSGSSSGSASSAASSVAASTSAAATSAASTSAAATSAASTSAAVTSAAATSAASTSATVTSAAATSAAAPSATTLSTVVASSTSSAAATTAASTTSTSSAPVASATKSKCLRRRRYRKGVPKSQ